MGPNTILDKSSFQGLSAREHVFASKHLNSNTTPVLVYEILGDLSKKAAAGSRPSAEVKLLAKKFGGSGGMINASYLILAREDMLGATVPMTGQIIPDNAVTTDRMTMVDLSPLNYSIMRWASGTFSESEKELSTLWRTHARSLGYSGLERSLRRHRLILPRPSDIDAIVGVVDDLLGRLPLQDVWVEWAIEHFASGRSTGGAARRTWQASPRAFLQDHAPYAHHCLRCLLALLVAVKHGFLGKQPTHLIDLQYLYYLPFCHVLVSDDKVHRRLAPPLMRSDQSFVRGLRLKASLAAVADEWEGLPKDAQRRRSFALGEYPPPIDPPALHELWRKHMRPWDGSRPSGNMVIKLNEAEVSQAMAEARQAMGI